MYDPPADMEEMLRPWVDVVDFHEPDEACQSHIYSDRVLLGANFQQQATGLEI